ncbi:phage tail protein [Streptococcus chenjunshii]|uniref:Phage tail protein n=1 Tax=Streptococcus chenjunshii TaxID=2173853 RepID=A0A372KLQ5_9STRE|nr:distal tail protein Dit [Streptococcus chenjunshii]AXQ79422.1 phage tail protein [Streptococcus chenjunshii]RFU51121.1 phage tail protein [Streptococcus chenjunshii]RFU53219.1 phage tail protein [Streptococcus chenjunshii]
MGIVTMTFDGLKLDETIEINDIQRGIGNERSITSSAAPKLGVNLQKVNTEAKTITVEFSIWSKDRNRVKHHLAGIFNVDEPKRLMFSDEPDKYYLALPINDIEMLEVSNYRSQGSMEFLVPDGTAHSTTYRRFTDYTEDNGKYTFEIDNQGNVDALPVITYRNIDENGYIGIVNKNGVFEAGDREEDDGKIVQKSQTLLNFTNDKIIDSLKQGTERVGITNDNSTETARTDMGTFKGTFGRDHIGIWNRGVSTSQPWITSSITWEIPADQNGDKGSLYDYIWWRQIFYPGDLKQRGFIKVTVSDEDDKFLYGFETMKRSTGLTTHYALIVRDEGAAYAYKVQHAWHFNATEKDVDNPFNSGRGYSDVVRSDDKISAYWFGSRKDFTVPGIKGKKSKKVHITFGQANGIDRVTHMYVDAFKYVKDKMSVWEDVPNKFSPASEVVMNSENNSLSVDGIDKLALRVVGSEFMTIPPGTSELQFRQSSWNKTKPLIEVVFEERWL